MISQATIKDFAYKSVLRLSRVIPQLKPLLRSHRELVLKIPKDPGNNWHENFIVHIASLIQPKVYVELGLYQCELFNRITPFAGYSIGVDMAPEAGSFMKKATNAEFVCLKTTEYAKIAKKRGIKIDLLFIDADHSEQSVRQDFESFLPLVNEQGIILLHDGFPGSKKFIDPGYCGDGYKAIEKLTMNNKDYEMMTIPLHPGLTLCRKRTKHLPWN